jgi:hypothetical protein
MKQGTKRILALLMAVAMLFSLTACRNDEDPNKAGETTADTGGEGTPGGDEGVFDFGVFRFSSRDFFIRPMSDVKIGGNMPNPASDGPGEGGGGAGAIRLFGFYGFGKPADGFPDYEDGSFFNDEIKDGMHGTIVSQNGAFWKTINKIEAKFYLEGKDGTVADDVSWIESVIQAPIGSWPFYQTGDNLLEQIVDDDTPFVFGPDGTMTVTWDMVAYSTSPAITDVDMDPDGNIVSTNYFDVPFCYETFTGGGVGKIILQIGSDNPNTNTNLTIHWVDVKIYVNDKDGFFSFVEQIEEITGEKISDDMRAKVIAE